jgi:hypothetical protein
VLSLGSNTDLRVCDNFQDALSHSSCQLVWNGTRYKIRCNPTSSPNLDLLSIFPFQSQAFHTPPPSPPPLPPQYLLVHLPVVTLSRSSSSLSTATTRTRSDVPLPTHIPGEVALIEKGSGDRDECRVCRAWSGGLEASHTRTFIRIHDLQHTATDNHRSLGNIHAIDTDGETVVRIEGLGYTNST